MRKLRQLPFRQKIRLSFGLLMTLIVFNAVVSALAFSDVMRQTRQQKEVEQVVSQVEQTRALLSRYIHTLSRESARQVEARIASTRQYIETTDAGLESGRMAGLLPLMDDFKRQFQDYVVEANQNAALASRLMVLAQSLLVGLNELQFDRLGHLERDKIDRVVGQLAVLQWQGGASRADSAVTEPMREARQALDELRQATRGVRGKWQPPLLRVLHEADEYLESFDAYWQFQNRTAATEQDLNRISDAIQQGARLVAAEVGQDIKRRIDLAIGLTGLILVLSIASAVVLTRYLKREIWRPIAGLAGITRDIAEGRLDVRAEVEVDDEIGDLSRAFNRMAQSLKQSQSALLEKNRALERIHTELEQRVDERTRQLADANAALQGEIDERAATAMELERANQALAVEELVQRQILDTAPIAIFLLDLQGRITQANRCMTDMFGYPLEVLQGKPYVDLATTPDRDSHGERLQALKNGELQALDTDRKFRRANGQEFWAHLVGRVLHGVSGQPLGLVGVISDISRRKQAEEQLRLAASVFTHAREGIVITDTSGAIIDVNTTFTDITGYSRDEVLGSNPRLLKSGRHGPEFYKSMWKELTDKGHWSGEVANRRKNGALYTEMLTISAVRDEQGQVLHYVALFTDISALKEQQRKLERSAHYDALTGLPNRVLLADRLRQAMAQSKRHGLSLLVAYLDLDGFKAVNDTHGHAQGDQLLVTLAERMKAALRESDTLARIGGDEFVAVLVDLDRPDAYEPVLQRLLQAAAQPVVVADTVLQVSASIGATLYPQDDGDADLLMRHADQAMYVAKQTGKNRHHLFDIAQDVAIQARHEIVEHVRRALDQQEFRLLFQPKVNMASGQVTGAEALLRWQHPQRGLLTPIHFLPLIETHPISIELGEWVMSAAMAQIGVWREAGVYLPVSINVSALQLRQASFVGRLRTLLQAHPDVVPGSLELEVVETAALEEVGEVTSIMRDCQALGVSFALDDFGTGYSSLTYLRNLPLQALKIDRSFISGMLQDSDDLAIVKGVIGLAKAFDCEVVAEGVESLEIGNMLLSIGCEQAQGYAISHPMTADDLPAWIAHWQSGGPWSVWRQP